MNFLHGHRWFTHRLLPATAILLGWFGCGIPASLGAQPNSLRIVSISPGTGQVVLRWEGGKGPYQIICRTNLSSAWSPVGSPTSDSSGSIPLNQASTCFFMVTTDTSAPNTPANVQVSTNGHYDQLALQWDASSDNQNGSGVRGYKVYRNEVLLREINDPSTSFLDSGLQEFTAYSYSVSAVDMVGNVSSRSPDTTGRTPRRPGSCTYTLSSSSRSFTSSGGSGSVGVTAQGGCAWNATSSASWISITAGASGNGTGTVSYAVAANTSTSSRSGTLTLAGQTFTVFQAAAPLDNPPYNVVLTAPSGGSTLSGIATFSGTASDDNGVSRVEFWCDGTILLGADTTAPYSVTYDTVSLLTGTRRFMCKAFDTLGNSTASSEVLVEVSNVQPAGGTWAARFGGVGYDEGQAVALDASGNMVIAGSFREVVDFGGGILISAGGSDLFVAKFSPSGVHLWSRRFGGPGNEMVTSIALDASGNVFLGGSFSGTANFGGSNMVSAGDKDAFVAKYSSQCSHIWSQGFGESSTDRVNSLTVDDRGNVIVTGFFRGVYTPMTIGNSSLYSWSQADTFLAKFTPAGAGLWATNFYNGSRDSGNAVAVDSNDNILLAGDFESFIDFGGGQFNSPGGYLAKFSPDGQFLRARACGTNYPASISGLVLDSNGDVVIAGSFHDRTDLGNGTVFGTSYNSDMFLAKYSLTDFSYRWATVVVGNATVGAASIAVDGQNDIVLTGSFTGTVQFGGDSVSATSDGYLAKFSRSGDALWVRAFRATTSGTGTSVAVDGTGVPVFMGSFTGSVNLTGPTLTSAGSTDILVGRLEP